jgi:transcriptional regulator with XRE-family HTH domain
MTYFNTTTGETGIPFAEAVTDKKSLYRAETMQGRTARGLYPKVSRTKLAQALGLAVSTVGGYLRGRTRTPLDAATIIAREIGVPIDRLSRQLTAVQRAYKVEQRIVQRAAERRERAGREQKGN